MLATRASVWSVFSCWHARTRAGALVCCGGVGSVRSRIDRLLQLVAQVVLSAATCIVACNKSNATQPCLQQAVSTPAAQSRPVCMAVRALAGGRDRRHKVHCGHVGPRGLPFESALAGGADLARIGLAPIVPTAPMVPQTTAPKRAVAAQGVHTRHFEIQPRPLPCGCEHRPAHRQPRTAPLTCRPTVLCAVASRPCGLCGSVGSQVGNIVSVVLRGSTQNYLDDVERAVEDGTLQHWHSHWPALCCDALRCAALRFAVLCCAVLCCAVRLLVVLLGATEQSAHIAATE